MIGFIDISDGRGTDWVAVEEIEAVLQSVPVGNWETGMFEVVTRSGHRYSAPGAATAMVQRIAEAYIDTIEEER